MSNKITRSNKYGAERGRNG